MNSHVEIAGTGVPVRAWVEWLGRAGYAAKGFVYAAVGLLAAMQVAGMGGELTGTHGALSNLARQPFGDAVLLAIAVGLFSYTAWRYAQAVMDLEHKGDDMIGLLRRGGLLISGTVYAALAASSLRLIQGSDTGSDASGRAAEAMTFPGGHWAVIAVGIGLLAAGLWQVYRAYAIKFAKHWKASLNGAARNWATRFSRFGVAARAIAFIVMGASVTRAGLNRDPDQSRDLAATLQNLSQEPWLLGTMAVGLVCYGIYCFINAGYRRIPSPA